MDIQRKVAHSVKWSSITEIIARLMTPITNMILARILAPETFGILATVIMVISFAEIFVESGLQSFLIQHVFADEEQEHRYMSVALWSNLTVGILLWLGVVMFNRPIAALVNAPELGGVIVVMGAIIPVYAVIGIQCAKLKKDMEFKKLFYVRVLTAMVPLVITVPLALIGLKHWALIIGNICGVVGQFALLCVVGRFKPRFYFSFSELGEMFRSGVWTLLDGLAVWFTAWIDSLLIARYMSDYYLGLYKNATSMITSLFAMATSAFAPVLFSALSKLQNDEELFNKSLFNIQKMACMLLLPAGVGLTAYRGLATNILFGGNWAEATDIVGYISITLALRALFTSFYTGVYRAKGKFHIPLVLQLISLGMMIPAYLFAAKQGFWELVHMRAFMNLNLIIPEMIYLVYVCKITPYRTLRELSHPIVATLVMVIAIIGLQTMGNGAPWEICSIMICVCVYAGTLLMFKEERATIKGLLKRKGRNNDKTDIESN